MSTFLDRREFLEQGLRLSVASAAVSLPLAQAATENLPAASNKLASQHQAGQPFTNYGIPSVYERRVIRLIGSNPRVPGNGVSWTPLEALEGIVTPTGLHFERHHNGVPDVDPAHFELVIHGMVSRPLRFDLASLMRYPLQSRMLFLECGGNSNAGWHEEPMQKPVGSLHGLVSCSEWTGVPLRYVLDEAGIDTRATWAIAEGLDAAATEVSIPFSKLREDALLALFQNGERLRPENGYPLRLVLPGWEGVRQIKWLHRLEFTDQPAMTRNETAEYTQLLPSGKAEQFDFVMHPKSLITSPSHGQSLDAPGVFEVRGLAWSGHGSVAKVEVSADAGKTWATAHIEGPVMPKCFVRFRSAWKWDGKPAVLQSRVKDDQGYVQPTRASLVAQRGRNGYFHYNAIVSWAVDAEGRVRHVYA